MVVLNNFIQSKILNLLHFFFQRILIGVENKNYHIITGCLPSWHSFCWNNNICIALEDILENNFEEWLLQDDINYVPLHKDISFFSFYMYLMSVILFKIKYDDKEIYC